MKPVIHYMIGPTGSSAISYTDKRTTDFRSAEKSYYGRYGTDFLLSRLDLSVDSIGMQILNQGFRQSASHAAAGGGIRSTLRIYWYLGIQLYRYTGIPVPVHILVSTCTAVQ